MDPRIKNEILVEIQPKISALQNSFNRLNAEVADAINEIDGKIDEKMQEILSRVQIVLTRLETAVREKIK